MGSCHDSEVEMKGEEEIVLACMTAVPKGTDHIDISMMDDPTW